MKKFRITKVVFANNMDELLSMERGGEIVDITLETEILDAGQIGFVKQEHGKGHKMVSKVRKGS